MKSLGQAKRLRWALSGLSGLGAAIDTIAQAIQKQEGYYPGSIAYRNNNPGNLIYTNYYAQSFGASQGTPMKDKSGNVIGYFSSFPDYSTGLDALDHQIQVDAGRGLSIQGMMDKYAPARDANGNLTGNDPVLYAQGIANSLGVSPEDSLSVVLAGDGGTSSPLPTTQDYSNSPADDQQQATQADVNWGLVGLAAAAVVGLMLVVD